MSHLPVSIQEKMVMKAPPPNEVKYWNEGIETMPRRELMELQWELVREQIKYVYERSRFYKKRLDEAGVKPDEIRSIEDFNRKVPITCKDDIRLDIERTGDIFGGTLCVPLQEVFYAGPSTGTTGQPTQTALTPGDMTFARENVARQFWTMGLRPGDFCMFWVLGGHPGMPVCQRTLHLIGMPYSELALCPAFFEAELDRWTQTMQKLPVATSWVPYTLLWTYKDYIEKCNVSPKDTLGRSKLIFTSGDIVTSALRQSLEDYWGTELHEMALTADVMFGFHTCEVRGGLHVPEDLFVIEVVDPWTGEPVPMGQPGYLVVTPTYPEATCHLRWNSEDIVHMSDEPCQCGRTSTRIWFHGRLINLVNIQGQDIFPSAVTDELLQIPEIGMMGLDCQMVKTSPTTQDRLLVRTAYYKDKVKDISSVREKVEDRLKARFSVPAAVEFMEPQEIAKHKFERVIKRY